ncbi:MAG: DUF362 domain-containing protein [bacterium]|nr:DUF362 domain-containing protein [bacterium]
MSSIPSSLLAQLLIGQVFACPSFLSFPNFLLAGGLILGLLLAWLYVRFFRALNWRGFDSWELTDFSLGAELARKTCDHLHSAQALKNKDLDDFSLFLTVGLKTSGLTRSGWIKLDPDLGSLARASELIRKHLQAWKGIEINEKGILPWVLEMRSPVPEIVISKKQKSPRSYINKEGVRLLLFARENGPSTRDMFSGFTEEIKKYLPLEPVQYDPDFPVVVENDPALNKIDQLDRVMEKAGLFRDLEEQWSRSGKSKNDFKIALKTVISMCFRRRDDGTYNDTELVFHLIEKLFERGFSNVTVVESQNLYGNWFHNREVLRVAAHAGYFDPSELKGLDLTQPYCGRVLVKGEEKCFRIMDLTYDAIPHDFGPVLGNWKIARTWLEADYRIGFTKGKTHFFGYYYTLAIKNTYGCLPEQDKMYWYHCHGVTSKLTARQLRDCPVDFSLVDSYTSADGLLGAKMKAVSLKTRTIWGGKPILGVNSVGAAMMGLDPMVNSFFTDSIREIGSIYPFQIEGQVRMFPRWRNIPGVISRAFPRFEKKIFHFPMHLLARIFTGQNDPEFPPKARFLRFRRAILIVPYPLLWFLDREKLVICLREFRNWIRIKISPGLFPISGKDRDFRKLVRDIPREDLSRLGDFIKKHQTGIADHRIPLKRYGYHFLLDSAVYDFICLPLVSEWIFEIIKGIRQGRWEADTVIHDIKSWIK